LKSQLTDNNQTISTNVQLILEQKVKILNFEEEIKKNSRELNLNCQTLAENKCELNNLRITNEIQVNELKSTVGIVLLLNIVLKSLYHFMLYF